jgi:hypothetical protein
MKVGLGFRVSGFGISGGGESFIRGGSVVSESPSRSYPDTDIRGLRFLGFETRLYSGIFFPGKSTYVVLTGVEVVLEASISSLFYGFLGLAIGMKSQLVWVLIWHVVMVYLELSE